MKKYLLYGGLALAAYLAWDYHEYSDSYIATLLNKLTPPAPVLSGAIATDASGSKPLNPNAYYNA